MVCIDFRLTGSSYSFSKKKFKNQYFVFNPELFAVRGDPNRDPRKHIVSIFYRVRVDAGAIPVAGDDARDAEWIDLEGLTAEQLAGDHYSIIEELRK